MMMKLLLVLAALWMGGCCNYSDNAPPPEGLECTTTEDCGYRGGCWAWSCTANKCAVRGAPDGDACAMSIDGASGTCAAKACFPHNGTTPHCEPLGSLYTCESW